MPGEVEEREDPGEKQRGGEEGSIGPIHTTRGPARNKDRPCKRMESLPYGSLSGPAGSGEAAGGGRTKDLTITFTSVTVNSDECLASEN